MSNSDIIVTTVEAPIEQRTILVDLVGPDAGLALAAATAAAASATAAVSNAEAFVINGEQPNLVARSENTFDDLSRWNAGAIVKNTFAQVGHASRGQAVGKITAAVGASTSANLTIPRSAISGNRVSASVRVAKADAAAGTGSTSSFNRFLVIQKDAANAEIVAARKTVSMFGAAGLAGPQDFTHAGIDIDPACVTIVLSFEVVAIGSTAGAPRNLYIQRILVASGENAAYRPAPQIVPASSLAEAQQAQIAADSASSSVAALIRALFNGVSTPPADLGWSVNYAFITYKDGDTYVVTLDPRSLVNPAVWTGPAYYVNGTTGVDTNTGLTVAAALKSMTAAIAKGVAGGVPFRILPAAGLYYRAQGCFTLTAATPAFAIIPQGGRMVCGTFDLLTFANDGSATNTYTVTRSVVARVVDLLNVDAYGDHAEITQRANADVAGVRANAGSWCRNGSVLSVHRADGAAVTSLNTRVYLDVVPIDLAAYDTSVYIENMDVEGGRGVRITGGTRNFAAVDCTSMFMGVDTLQYDGMYFWDYAGLVFLDSCTSAHNAKDCFNVKHPVSTQNGYILTLNCTGYDAGRFGSVSNNGITAHDSEDHWIDIGGNYYDNDGSSVVPVGGSKMWCLGTTTSGSSTAGFQADSSAEMWLENTQAAETLSIYATNSGVIHKRNHASAGAETVATGGTIDTF